MSREDEHFVRFIVLILSAVVLWFAAIVVAHLLYALLHYIHPIAAH